MSKSKKSRKRSINVDSALFPEHYTDMLTAAAAASMKHAKQVSRIEAKLENISDAYKTNVSSIVKASQRTAYERILTNFRNARARAYRDVFDDDNRRKRIECAWTRATRSLDKILSSRNLDKDALKKLHTKRLKQIAKTLDSYTSLPPPELEKEVI